MDDIRKYKLAVCQMDSRDDKEANLREAGRMIAEAAAMGADVVAFPENMAYAGRGLRSQAEDIPGPVTDYLCKMAAEHQIWVMSGTFPETDPSGKTRNTLVLIGPEGQIRARYSKLHMFDVMVGEPTEHVESKSVVPGDAVTVVDTPFGRWGFAICYDLRFGELFRLQALAGAELIFVPSSFTKGTGADHWQVLLRARAIENGLYIAAPDQTGTKQTMLAYGKSMIIDPWGDVLAGAGDHTGIIMAEIDRDYLQQVRRRIPSLANRREDIYQLTGRGMN